MSVLIKDREMPKNCAGCFLRVGQCSKRIYMENRPSDCPLNEVPEPHGRLIDESTALNARYENMNWVYDVHDLEPFLSEIPTVIPAEDGET